MCRDGVPAGWAGVPNLFAQFEQVDHVDDGYKRGTVLLWRYICFNDKCWWNDHTICVGLWNRCTIQQNSPVLQWVCWKWTLSIAKDGGPSPLATPIRYFTVVVILIVVYMSFLRTDIIVLRSVAPLPSIITCRIIRRLRSSFTHSARSMIPFCRCRHH